MKVASDAGTPGSRSHTLSLLLVRLILGGMPHRDGVLGNLSRSTSVLPELQDTAPDARIGNDPIVQKMNIGVHLLDTEARNAIVFP